MIIVSFMYIVYNRYNIDTTRRRRIKKKMYELTLKCIYRLKIMKIDYCVRLPYIYIFLAILFYLREK